jgi:SAM-dependent methyltransferase
MANIDDRTVRAFGEEWSTFDQSGMSDAEARRHFARYFALFPWQSLPPNAVGADIGCGSGRWARFVAPRVGVLHCVDASDAALAVARRTLAGQVNCRFACASVDRIPLAPGSLDFCYSLGVLHHVPDTAAGIASCAKLLKPGAPMLLYLYYALDDRPWWYRALWRTTDLARRAIARLPFALKYALTTVIAAAVYWPLARLVALAERSGQDPRDMPLAYYRDKSFYTMRTDALDRFGTRLEQRFRRSEIETMMRGAGLTDIVFAAEPPFWCAIGRRGPAGAATSRAHESRFAAPRAGGY